MRIFAPLMLTLLVSVLLAGCGGQETPVEETEEESGAERSSIEETTREKTNDRAEATVKETTTATAVTETTAPEPAAAEPSLEPVGNSTASQGEESPAQEGQVNASPEEAMRDQSQTTVGGISATQTVAPDPATVGSPLTFTVVVTNNSSPQHVGFKDFLPPGMTFVSATPSQGYCGPPHHGGNLFDCTLGTIPTGGSVAVEIIAIPTAPGTLTNDAQAGTGYAPVTSVPATFTVNP